MGVMSLVTIFIQNNEKLHITQSFPMLSDHCVFVFTYTTDISLRLHQASSFLNYPCPYLNFPEKKKIIPPSIMDIVALLDLTIFTFSGFGQYNNKAA
jgi:hypothetical protein